jgi:DegV family protein with EDD domain
VSKVAIVTDTISCLPTNLVRQYDVQVVPIGLIIDKKLYLDNEISNSEFWELFKVAKEPVTTAAGNPLDFEKVFLKLAQQTREICCILVSKKLSATHDAAVLAKKAVEQKNSYLNINIIDSRTAAGGEGFVVLEAARAAMSGRKMIEVLKVVEDMIPRVKLMCTLATLKYLIRSGRAPKSAVIGNWLQIKPILGMVSGTGLVENLDRARGIEGAIDKMISMVKKYIPADRPLHVMAHYTDGIAVAEKIRDLMLSRYNCCEMNLIPYTPVIASQTGPLAAISFYA